MCIGPFIQRSISFIQIHHSIPNSIIIYIIHYIHYYIYSLSNRPQKKNARLETTLFRFKESEFMFEIRKIEHFHPLNINFRKEWGIFPKFSKEDFSKVKHFYSFLFFSIIIYQQNDIIFQQINELYNWFNIKF